MIREVDDGFKERGDGIVGEVAMGDNFWRYVEGR
jgi:hypothetical protein